MNSDQDIWRPHFYRKKIMNTTLFSLRVTLQHALIDHGAVVIGAGSSSGVINKESIKIKYKEKDYIVEIREIKDE